MLLSFPFGCSQQNEQSNDILDKDAMAIVLADVQLIESSLKVNTKDNHLKSDSVNLYSAIFEEHQIDREIFKKNMNYYSIHPELMEEVYDKVLILLSDRLAEYEDQSTMD